MKATFLQRAQTPGMHRPYGFDRITVHSAGQPVLSILGVCYSSDQYSPNGCTVADIAGELMGRGYYGVDTFRSLGSVNNQ